MQMENSINIGSLTPELDDVDREPIVHHQFSNIKYKSNLISFFPNERKLKQKKKRKKEEVAVPDLIFELKEDLDRELDIKAQRNNLTATNVKKMIKAVITDSEVIKMIDYTLDKSTEKPVYELKLTRAKTKELVGLDQNAIWSMPIIQKKSDIEALINQELSEDSSDEEYEPQDEGSDEDSKSNENTVDEESIIDEEYSESDSPLKERISPGSNENNSDENIWQRTRSKLCLSETPLEEIEQAFLPPDITTDMYNTNCDNQDWLNFLKDIYFDSNQLESNDDENDPEYNVMVDEEIEGTDIEELRVDRAVKVTKKELNELMSELFEYTEMLSSDDEEENKDEDVQPVTPKDDVELSSSTSFPTAPSNGMEVEDRKGETCINYHDLTEKQNCLLKQQLEQHVQLLLQSFLLSYKHPLLPESYALECRKRIMELNAFKSNSSITGRFYILNLESSVELIDKWVEYLDNQENLDEIKRFMDTEIQKFELYKKKKTIHLPELHPRLIELCLSSYAFLHPLYLPKGGFTGSCTISKGFSFYENQLIAMGLEEFSTFFGLFPEKNEDLRKIVEFINYYLVSPKSVSRIMFQIQVMRKSTIANPIKEFFETHKSPQIHHFVVVQKCLRKLCGYPLHYFPTLWVKHILKCNKNMKT